MGGQADSVPCPHRGVKKSRRGCRCCPTPERSKPLRFRIFYSMYRFVFRLLTGRTIRFGNFVALSRRSVGRLINQETWVHFAASLMVSRLRIGTVETDRGTRYAGKSQMNFISLTLHGLRNP